MRILIGLPLASLALPAVARDCASGIAPAGVTVTEAVATPATDEIPMAHCLIRARMAERTGTDGKPYAISFELRLPDNWSGRFVHQFNGGNDGRVVPALGARDELAPGDSALACGFAVVSSDAGHDGAANPEAGLAGSNLFGIEFEARRAYGYTAVAKLHPVALAMVEALLSDNHLVRCRQTSWPLPPAGGRA